MITDNTKNQEIINDFLRNYFSSYLNLESIEQIENFLLKVYIEDNFTKSDLYNVIVNENYDHEKLINYLGKKHLGVNANLNEENEIIEEGLIFYSILATLPFVLKAYNELKRHLVVILNNIANRIRKNTELTVAFERAFDMLPKQCRLLFIEKDFKGITKLVFGTIMGINKSNIDTELGTAAIKHQFLSHIPLSTYNIESIKNSAVIKCLLRYLLESIKINLDFYLKCLLDNKEFMSLISDINKLGELATNPDVISIVTITKASSSNCNEFYKTFGDLVKLYIILVENVYKDEKDVLYDYREKLKDVILGIVSDYNKKLEKLKKDKENSKRNSKKSK